MSETGKYSENANFRQSDHLPVNNQHYASRNVLLSIGEWRHLVISRDYTRTLEEHSEWCLSAAMVDNRYDVIETRMTESQPS